MPIGTNPVSSSSILSNVLKVEKVLTNAQILTLDTVDIDLISLPAGNIILCPLFALFTANTVVAYTNLDAAATIQIEWSGITYRAMTVIDNAVATSIATLLAAGTSRFLQLIPSAGTATNFGNLTTLRSTTDSKIVLSMTNAAAGNLTGGNAANVLAVQLFYLTIPLII